MEIEELQKFNITRDNSKNHLKLQGIIIIRVSLKAEKDRGCDIVSKYGCGSNDAQRTTKL